jgi:hypothetical protein
MFRKRNIVSVCMRRYGISCVDNRVLNLKHIFEKIDQILADNEKHFKKFYLNDLVQPCRERDSGPKKRIQKNQILKEDCFHLFDPIRL